MKNVWFTNSKNNRALAPRASVYSSLFDDFFRDTTLSPVFGENYNQFVPKINVLETDTEYKVLAELPGLEEKDFEITLEDDVIKLKGEKKNTVETKDGSYHKVESSYGSFERHLKLPEATLPEKVKAQFKNGLLTLTIEKNKELSKVHKLKIES